MRQRMELLCKAGAISQRSYLSSLEALATIDNEITVHHESEQYQMAMTHFARALDRIWNGEEVTEGLDAELMQEITSDPYYRRVKALHDKLLKVVGLDSVPEHEESYMIANIFALIQVSEMENEQ